ncbi:unnamed protein product [Vitrella brassicaformis CCMP3155]|uniref:PLOD1-3-like GT domain-containing protein n=2 Tax=Vitrella brassicaformis TaxID=1169539 RepID=A0A0G4GJ05_VITBC|nr:unnamed protein product [Vitrella brassicaformis CCMP3155]|mmetsp:Transcript_14900/g.35515  ORF Transcript_14900/g.35515 Transcript_14900/m.35515 type:complete len:558 (+) Transcript_14900:108-1781(+)|eukprot:CEM29822.1 unnamed protein product [Vitrella brassicaformis CCMP3155]
MQAQATASRFALLFAAAFLGVFLISSFVGVYVSSRGWLSSSLRGIVCTSGAGPAPKQREVPVDQLVVSHVNGSLPAFVLVTIGQNPEHPGYRALSRSASYYGVHFLTLGQDQTKGGKEAKLEIMRRWLWRQDPDLLVIFTDGYDTLVRIPNEELERRMRLLIPDNDNTTIVVSSELGIWPKWHLKHKYPMPPSHVENAYRYLNSGGYAGRAGALALCLDKYPPREDDQLFFTNRFLEQDVGHGVTVKLDYERLLFQTLTRVNPEEWMLAPATYRSRDGEGMVNGLTFARTDGKDAAAVLHGNGGGRPLYHQMRLLEAGAWSFEEGSVWYERSASPYEQPRMVLAVICAHPTGNNSEFVEGLMAMEVDYSKTDIFVSSGPSCDLQLDESFKQRFAAAHEHVEATSGNAAHKEASRLMRQVNASHLLILENNLIVQQHDLVAQLVQDELPAAVPLAVSDSGQANFGVDKAAFKNGAFRGSYHEEDRDKLVSCERPGLWPAKCWSSCILLRHDYKEKDALRLRGVGDGWCDARQSIFLDNRHRFGKLLSSPVEEKEGEKS